MKQISVKDDTWKGLSQLKLKLDFKTLDDVISLLYNAYIQHKGWK